MVTSRTRLDRGGDGWELPYEVIAVWLNVSIMADQSAQSWILQDAEAPTLIDTLAYALDAVSIEPSNARSEQFSKQSKRRSTVVLLLGLRGPWPIRTAAAH